jgi:MYXO-CTERM domain-containing protein
VISANVAAFEGVTLDNVTLRITDGDDQEVFTSSASPAAASYTLNVTWDGMQDGAALPAGQYTATVTATDSQARESSDQVVVTLGLPAPPMISNLAAMPDPFLASGGETTQITADVAAFEGIELSRVTVNITDADGVSVFGFVANDLSGADYALSIAWNGAQDEVVLPAGQYTVTVTATDSLEQVSEATTTITISVPLPVQITGLSVTPETIAPDDGQSAQITADVEAFGGLGVQEVVVVVTSQGDVEWFRQVIQPDAPSFALDTSWDGRSEDGDLALAGPYTVTVTAVDTLGQTDSASATVNVVNPEPPLIEDLVATPEVINVSQGETTQVTATVTSRSSEPLARVRVKVRNAATFAVIRDWSFDVDAETYDVDVTWDGRFGNGNVVNNGDYDINVEATDGNEHRSAMSTTVTVTSDMTEEDMDMGVDMDEDVVDPDMIEDDMIEDDMVDPDMVDPDMEDPDMADPDMIEDAIDPDMVDPDVVEDVVDPDVVDPDVVEDVVDPDVVDPDIVEEDMVEPDVVEPDVVEPDVVEEDMAGADVPVEDMGQADTGEETPDVQGGGGSDDCSCSTPAAPASVPSPLWLLGALGGVLMLRRRR